MIVHKLTLAEFKAGLTEPTGETTVDPFDDVIEPAAALLKDLSELDRNPIPGHPGYATTMLSGGDALLVKDDNGQLAVVGGYIGDTIGIKCSERGQRLSTELILRCCAFRSVPTSRMLTTAGYRALRRAHKTAVQRALDAGEDVPDAVLKDYEDET